MIIQKIVLGGQKNYSLAGYHSSLAILYCSSQTAQRNSKFLKKVDKLNQDSEASPWPFQGQVREFFPDKNQDKLF